MGHATRCRPGPLTPHLGVVLHVALHAIRKHFPAVHGCAAGRSGSGWMHGCGRRGGPARRAAKHAPTCRWPSWDAAQEAQPHTNRQQQPPPDQRLPARTRQAGGVALQRGHRRLHLALQRGLRVAPCALHLAQLGRQAGKVEGHALALGGQRHAGRHVRGVLPRLVAQRGAAVQQGHGCSRGRGQSRKGRKLFNRPRGHIYIALPHHLPHPNAGTPPAPLPITHPRATAAPWRPAPARPPGGSPPAPARAAALPPRGPGRPASRGRRGAGTRILGSGRRSAGEGRGVWHREQG